MGLRRSLHLVYTPFEYRWGAMKLRKEGMNARVRAQNYRKQLSIRKLSDAVDLSRAGLRSNPRRARRVRDRSDGRAAQVSLRG